MEEQLGGSALSVIGHDVVSAGASGAIFGVIGCLFSLRASEVGGFRMLPSDHLARPWIRGVGIWLVLGLMLPIDTFAHVGGLLVGLVFGATWPRRAAWARACAPAFTVGLCGLALRPLPVIHAGSSDLAQYQRAWAAKDYHALAAPPESLRTDPRTAVYALSSQALAGVVIHEWATVDRATEELLRIDPRNAIGLTSRCALKGARGQPLAGVSDCRRAAELSPREGWIQTVLVDAVHEAGQHDEALAVANKLEA